MFRARIGWRTQRIVRIIAATEAHAHIGRVHGQRIAVAKLGDVSGPFACDAGNVLALLLQRVEMPGAESEGLVEGLAPNWRNRLHRCEAASFHLAAHRRPTDEEGGGAPKQAGEALCVA